MPQSRASRRRAKGYSGIPSSASYPSLARSDIRRRNRAPTCVFIGKRFLDIALDNAFAQMNGAGGMRRLPFVIFAHIHQLTRFAGCSMRLYSSISIS